jgi:hypothetical protein
MKKLLAILLLTGCTKVVSVAPIPPTPSRDIFSVSQNAVSNGSEIVFSLKKAGTYTLTMGDSVTNQVVTRERFKGKVGENKLKIYTKSLPIKYLYLILEDSTKTQIGKTAITIN